MSGWRRSAVAGFLVVFIASSTLAHAAETLGPPAPAAAAPAAIIAVKPNSIDARIELSLAGAGPVTGVHKYPGQAADLAAARAYYAARTFSPLWVSEDGLNSQAALAMGEIARAGDWGLKASDFELPKLTANDRSASIDALADAELTLTRAVLKYARHARGGRIADPGLELSGFIDRKPQLIAPQTVLEQMVAAPKADAMLRGFHPAYPQFEKLRQAYLLWREERGRSAALRVPSGPLLKPGQSHPNVAALRKRLGVPVGAVVSEISNPELFYDPALFEAVKAFQRQAGMRRADGIVGDKTVAALNGTGDGSRKDTGSALLANMEQWRWMPAILGTTHILVNIPEYEMRLIRGGNVVHRERVVTGKLETATPAFSADMATIVFQPKWGVPPSIKVNELLPQLQKGRGLKPGLRMMLNGRDIDPWSVDWSRADITKYMIYQPAGDDNALGAVKFLFPNSHAVYLHDTPSKSLFNATTRAYSHGCVRLRNPVRLAELLLGADKGWSAQAIRDLVDDGPEDNAIKLDAKIPVHITYFTASVDEQNRLNTFRDVYGHERRITLALDGRFDQIVKLDPLPLGVAKAVQPGQQIAGVTVRRLTGKGFARPSGLGFAPPVEYQPRVIYAPNGSQSRFRGSSPNDVIMRQLGGGY